MAEPGLFQALGVKGLRQWSGYISEEFLRPLRGLQRNRTYQEMRDNEPMIGASLWAIELLMRQVSWRVNPGSDDLAGQAAAAFVEEALFSDLDQTWQETLSEILSLLVYGWSVHEIVYKRRRGDNRDPLQSSKFVDGRIGWASWGIRAQDTIDHWGFDSKDTPLSVTQQSPHGGSYTIALEKCLLFRVKAHKGNPEGVSLLRNVYVPWYHKKRILEFQAIGIERDLAGLPVMYVPAEIMDASAPAAVQAVRAEYEALIQGVRRNENEGIILPSVYDSAGHRLYELTLLSAGGAGRRQFDTAAIIKELNTEMLIAMFTDVLMLGHEKVGSFALSSSKTSMLSLALSSLLESITGVINRYAIPRLWRLNGLPSATQPTLTHGDIESVDLGELGGFIERVSRAGLDVTQFEQEVWQRAGFTSENAS